MANINEALLNRHTLANAGEESRAAGQLREDQAQDRVGSAKPAEKNQPEGSTLNQLMAMAKNARAAAGSVGVPSAGGTGGGGFSGMARFLKQAWMNMLDPFAIPLALLYINFHVFGHSVLGEKIFCALGEEWIPANLKAGAGAEASKGFTQKIGLLEKIILIILDLVVLIVLLGIMAIIVSVAAFIADNPLQKAAKIFTAITSLGWGGVSTLFNLFTGTK